MFFSPEYTILLHAVKLDIVNFCENEETLAVQGDVSASSPLLLTAKFNEEVPGTYYGFLLPILIYFLM